MQPKCTLGIYYVYLRYIIRVPKVYLSCIREGKIARYKLMICSICKSSKGCPQKDIRNGIPCESMRPPKIKPEDLNEKLPKRSSN